jgi:hypothetical protein
VRFVFGHDSLAALPPALGPQPSPGETVRREVGTEQGIPWSAFDPQATFTARSPESGVVRGPDWTTKLEILARGELTGDESDDVLVRTLSYGTAGSWSEIRLRVLSHDANQPVLVIRKELPL